MCSMEIVHVSSCSHTGPVDPVKRLIGVHRKSLRHAHRHHWSAVEQPCQRIPDPIQQRIVVNALRREIDRLLRGIDHQLCGQSVVQQETWRSNPTWQADDSKLDGATSSMPSSRTSGIQAHSMNQLGPGLAVPLAPTSTQYSAHTDSAGGHQNNQSAIDIVA